MAEQEEVRTDTQTLIGTLRTMARHVPAGDKWAIAEAADRLEELEAALNAIRHEVQTAHRYWTTPANGQRVAKIPWLYADAARRLMRMLPQETINGGTHD